MISNYVEIKVLGNPTVDIQLVDAEGNEYVVMATCGVIESMGAAARSKREMDQGT